MFGFKKHTPLSTLLIDGLDVITDSQMTVASVWQQRHVPSNIGLVLTKAICNSSGSVDTAIKTYVDIHGMSTPQYEPFHQIPFDRQSGISGNIWHHGTDYEVVIKGMPERVLEHCDMSENERESVTTQLHALSASGAIVIAVASGIIQHSVKNLGMLKNNDKLSFVGFVNLQANVSNQSRQLITVAHSKNIAVLLCTGQHHTVAFYLASQLGIVNTPSDVIDADRHELLKTAINQNQTLTVKVFSRCLPEHRNKILSVVRTIDPTVKVVSTASELKKLLAS